MTETKKLNNYCICYEYQQFFLQYNMDRIQRRDKCKAKSGKYVYSGKHIRQKEALMQKQQQEKSEIKMKNK